MKIFSFFIAVLFSLGTVAQIKDPVNWSVTSRKAAGGYELVLTATMPKQWHIYSQFTGEGGPVATTIKFSKNPLVTFDGKIKEVGKIKEQYDKLFNTNVKYFSDKVDFVQSLKVKGNVKTNVNVTIEYMTCNDSQCLPPAKKTFTVSL